MRTLELALLLADLLAFVALAVQRLRALNRLGWAALAAPAVAAAQMVIEGSRWQMVPAYALGVLFLALWLRAPSPSRARGFASTALVVLGVLALLGAAAVPAVLPVFRFPRPTGPYAIGTLTYHWIDSTRPEAFTPDPSDRRELMVQLWYPARYQRGAARARYVEHPETLQPLARLLGLPGFTLSYLDQVRTRAVDSAPAAGGPYPVLIFAHGRGGYRQHNTALVQELVSHGYVVAAMDQPGAASGVAFPDGRTAPFDPRMFDPSAPGHPPFLDSVIPFLARDASFTLDRLAALDTGDPEGILTRRLDLRHAGMFGVSLGGTVTAEACRRDPRLRACLMMDTFMPADVVASGLRQPAMWLTRDSASMRLEHWPERDIDETQGTMRAVFGTLPGDGYIVLVPGAFHPNFSDMPLFSPLVRRLGLVGPIDPRRGLQIVDAFSLAFFERELEGRPARLLERPADRFPEVRFERRGNDRLTDSPGMERIEQMPSPSAGRSGSPAPGSLPTRRLGRSGLSITAVGFGAWAIGGEWAFGWGPQDDEASVAAMRHALDRGINWIDTAAVYGLGHSEEVVGRLLRELPGDRRPLVFTKCGMVWDENDRSAEVRRTLQPESIRRECEASLRRLGIERIDLYQFHWPDQTGTPVEDSWGAMVRLVEQGKVRAIGVSNFDPALLERCERVRHVDSAQPPFSLIRRNAAEDVIPWCAAHETGVIGYSPMQSGILTDGFSAERVASLAPGDWRRKSREFQQPNLTRNLALRDALRPVAQRHGTTVAAVAVAWTLAWPGVSGAIVGARSPEQVDGWIGAATLTLTAADLDEIADATERSAAGSGPTRVQRPRARAGR